MKKTWTILTFLIFSLTLSNELIAQPSKDKVFQLKFDNLNDFILKGLPAAAELPVGDIDEQAITMARVISKFDETSLPMLLTALQTAGFFIIDENRKILKKPLKDGKGQGLAFYDFETVGMLKLDKHGIPTSLNKIASLITKDNSVISSANFSDLMLQELQENANNDKNEFLRFWARLIIELGKSSDQPVDLMTASSKDVNLTMLQATLWTRRLSGDFYTIRKSLEAHGSNDMHNYENHFIVFG
jgi:hypothetical protein